MRQYLGVEDGRKTVPSARAVFYPLVLALILFGFLTVPVRCQDAATWSKWGAAPFASSQLDACKKASTAINGFTISAKAK